MKIAITTVSNKGTFESRFAAFKKALEQAKGQGVDLLCLPGGYFCVKSDAELKRAENRIVQQAKRTGIAIAVGIDRSPSRKPAKKKTRSNTNYHSFASAWRPRQRYIKSWPQRSVNSEDQWDVSEEDCKRPQTLPVSGKEIEILACGELFNECIRNCVADRHPDAVVDLSHSGRGFRADPALKLLAKKGMYAFCCTHADMKGAMKRGFAPGGDKISTRKTNALITGEPRIEMEFWKI